MSVESSLLSGSLMERIPPVELVATFAKGLYETGEP
jgi:hypothetical protein